MIRSRIVSLSLLITLCLTGAFNVNLNAQETIVFDGVIDWEWYHNPQPWYGGNSFYWWHRSYERGITNYGDMSPTNWRSPADYRDGHFYMRLEVFSQPSDEDFEP